MRLDDAELQQTTGFLIAKGSLNLGSETDIAAFGNGPHTRVLLSSTPNVTIWPVTHITRDEYGFCEPTLGEVGLTFRSLSPDDIWQLSPPGAGRRSLMRGGSQTGELRRRVKLGNNWTEKPGGSIQHFELETEYGPEGLRIAISGQVVVEGERVEPFSVDITIPWPTLTLKGIPSSVAYWKFGHPQGLPSKFDSANRPRDSRKLSDLLLSQGLTWPYLKGRISFTPERTSPPHDFVSVHFRNGQIGFSDQPRLEVLDTGFARSFASSRQLTIAMFDRERLEAVLRQRNTASIRLEGDAIGSVRYRTGYAEEAGDPLGWIVQAIRTMAFHLALDKDGLGISADGELGGFDPSEFAVHREQRNSQLKPFRTYSVRAVMPWALLVARGFSFAHRARDL